MKLHYDPQVDVMHLILSDVPVAESEEVRPGIVLDYDDRNRVVGIEVLNLRRLLPEIDPKRLEMEVA